MPETPRVTWSVAVEHAEDYASFADACARAVELAAEGRALVTLYDGRGGIFYVNVNRVRG